MSYVDADAALRPATSDVKPFSAEWQAREDAFDDAAAPHDEYLPRLLDGIHNL